MKKVAFAFLFLVSGLWSAELNTKGYLRGMYLGGPDFKASAVGGSLEITPREGDFYADAAFFNSTPIGIRKDAVSTLFSSSENGHTILGVASLGYKKNSLEISIGRQRVSTPLVDMDDGRIVPNLFEGVSLKYSATDKIRLEAYYLTRMSGFWSTIYSGEDMSKFVSMSRATGYGDIVSDSALSAVGAIYDDGSNKINLWGYSARNLMSIYYGEYVKSIKIGENSTIYCALQGTTQNADGTLKKHLNSLDKTLSQQYAALKIGATNGGFEVYGAAAKVNDSKGKLDKNMMNVWAGIPQYTVFNEHVMKSFDTDGAKLYKGFLGYKFPSNLEATASHIYVDGNNQRAVADISVSQLTLSKQSGNFSISGVALFRRDGGDYTRTMLKSTVEYKF